MQSESQMLQKSTTKIINLFFYRALLNICLDEMDRFSEEQQDEIIEIVRDPAQVEAVDPDADVDDIEPVDED
jgi:hypothetical protein